jgi:hypothetical protein
MTKIISHSHPLKTFSSQNAISKDLMSKFQVKDFFVEIEKEFMSAVIKKCHGNPLLSISLVH